MWGGKEDAGTRGGWGRGEKDGVFSIGGGGGGGHGLD